MTIKLSICIPTFNRNKYLDNCLNSIKISSQNHKFNFEVCISDNYSIKNPIEIVRKYENFFKIKYNRHNENKGLGVNILKSVSLASGEYAWIIGNDDLLLPNTFKKLDCLFQNVKKDFYYINSFHLYKDYLKKYPHPFDTKYIPKKLKSFSNHNKNRSCKFYQLVNPNISFDFMLGMFLLIFKRKIWNSSLNIINKKNVEDKKTYSTFDNTAPHIKIFAKGYLNRDCFFHAKALSVNLSGVREWHVFYPFVESFRIPEILQIYKKNGLSYLRFILCSIYANRKFLINFFKIYFSKKYRGKEYLNFFKDIFPKFFNPTIYFFFIYYFFRKIYKLIHQNLLIFNEKCSYK